MKEKPSIGDLAEKIANKDAIPIGEALKENQTDPPADEGDKKPLNILRHADSKSAQFYMDAARELADNLPNIDTQISSGASNFNDISSVISNKASIVGRIVTFVEKSWDTKKEGGDIPGETYVKKVLDEVDKVMKELDIPQDVKDRFFMQLSQELEKSEK